MNDLAINKSQMLTCNQSEIITLCWHNIQNCENVCLPNVEIKQFQVKLCFALLCFALLCLD